MPDAGAAELAGRPETSRARFVVLALTLALVSVAYLDRVCIATAAPAIRRDLGFDEEQMGFVFSAFTLFYALAEVPSGYLADRYGPRLALTRIVLWWSVMTAATGLATGFASLLLLRALFGVGEAGAYPAIARVYSRWLPARERGWAFGLVIATGAVAGAATMRLVVVLLGAFTWRVVFALFGGVGAVWAVGWWWYFRDEPHAHPRVSPAELRVIGHDASGAAARHPAVPWGLIARSPSLLGLCGMYVCAIYGWYFFLTWMPTYLLSGRGFDLSRAGALSSLPLLGIALGVWAGGGASDRLVARFGARARKWPGLVGFPLAGVVTMLAAGSKDASSSAFLLAAAAGLGAAGVAPAWAACLEIGGEHAGVISGAMNMFGNLGGTLCPIVVGMCVKRLGSWQIALGSVAATYVLGAVLLSLVDVTRPIEPPAE
jgi:MFS transporter, ACS family, glucarate transporter